MYTLRAYKLTSSYVFRSLLITMAICSLGSLVRCSGGGGGGDGDTTPPTPGLVGSWAGSINSSFAGTGTIALDITEEVLGTLDSIASAERGYASTVSGFWTANFAGNVNDNAGTFTGVGLDGMLSGTLESINGCPATFDSTVTDFTIEGTFSAFKCDVVDNGNFMLAKQSEDVIPDIDGIYSGSISSNVAGTGTVVFAINQIGLNFTGRVTADFAGSTFDTAGDIIGTIDGNSLELKFSPDSSGECPFSATATISGQNSNTISGSFKAFSCSEPVFGNFNIVR